MELVKKVVNMLVENRIHFFIYHHPIFVEIHFATIGVNCDSVYDIQQLVINKEYGIIQILNYDSPILNELCAFKDLKQFTPFKVTE